MVMYPDKFEPKKPNSAPVALPLQSVVSQEDRTPEQRINKITQFMDEAIIALKEMQAQKVGGRELSVTITHFQTASLWLGIVEL